MIYYEKYNKISSEEIRKKIFEFVFKKENLFLKSKILINYFFNDCFIPHTDDEENNNEEDENDNNDNEKYEFMDFLKEDSEVLKIIETNINNNQSEKFILNYFEIKLKDFFDKNKSDIDGLSFEYLKKFFDILQEKCGDEFKYKILTKLYCIAYINNYCYFLINHFNIQENNYKLLEILNNKDLNFYNMIKLLICKIYFILKCKYSYEEFLKLNYEFYNFNFFPSLKQKFENIKYDFKNYFFLIKNDFNIEEYKKNIICFINSYLNNFEQTNNEYYEKLIKDKKIIKLFDFFCNQYFYGLKNIIDKKIHENFSKNYKNIISELNDTQKNILNLFFDSKYYNNIEYNINSEDYEDFLNCIKLCLILGNYENFFYKKLISNIKLINDNYIPGLNNEENKKGYLITKFEEFKNNCNNNIRNMNNKTYIILNYIYFSIIYINKILGYISDDEIDNYKFESKNISEIIKEINLLLEEKLKKNKYELNIYINLVLEKLYKNDKINFEDYDNFNSLEERNKFEQKFNEIIKDIDDEYNSYSEEFKNINEQLKKNNLDIFYYLIAESNELNLEKNEDFKYFNLLNVPYFVTIDDFNAFFDKQNKTKFPIINYYLKHNKDEKFKDLENILIINPFELYLLEKYSNKITRTEAKENKKIEDLISKENEKMFEDFKEGYNNICKKIKVKKGDKIIEAKELENDDKLIYFLNDDLEEKGFYLYKIYEHFTNIQNECLKEIRHPFHTIIPQKAKEEDIISFKINERYKKYYSSFNEIISLLSNEKNEKKQFSINEIESIFYDILIQGKKFFSEKQLKIIFKGEGIFEENEESFRYKLKKLYEPIPLEDNLIKAIDNYFNNITFIEFEKIIQALDQIIKILIDKKYNKDDNIKEKILNNEKYKNKLNDFNYKMFDDTEISKIKIGNLINVYE